MVGQRVYGKEKGGKKSVKTVETRKGGQRELFGEKERIQKNLRGEKN